MTLYTAWVIWAPLYEVPTSTWKRFLFSIHFSEKNILSKPAFMHLHHNPCTSLWFLSLRLDYLWEKSQAHEMIFKNIHTENQLTIMSSPLLLLCKGLECAILTMTSKSIQFYITPWNYSFWFNMMKICIREVEKFKQNILAWHTVGSKFVEFFNLKIAQWWYTQPTWLLVSFWQTASAFVCMVPLTLKKVWSADSLKTCKHIFTRRF